MITLELREYPVEKNGLCNLSLNYSRDLGKGNYQKFKSRKSCSGECVERRRLLHFSLVSSRSSQSLLLRLPKPPFNPHTQYRVVAILVSEDKYLVQLHRKNRAFLMLVGHWSCRISISRSDVSVTPLLLFDGARINTKVCVPVFIECGAVTCRGVDWSWNGWEMTAPALS